MAAWPRPLHEAVTSLTGRPHIVAADLRKVFRRETMETVALDGIDLSIREGEFLAIVGPSGCGKSTFLRLIAGLTAPTSGSLELAGETVNGPQTALGVVFQSPVLLDWRNILDNVLIQVELRGLNPKSYRDKAMALLEQVGLAGFHDRYPRELSGGMRQRASIVRALIHDPPLLLMDEPFGALDAMTRDQMGVDIQKILRTTSSTVLFITHSITEAIFLSDRVLVFGPPPGRIVEEVVVDLPRPRRMAARETPEFGRYVRRVRDRLSEMGVIHEDFPEEQTGV